LLDVLLSVGRLFDGLVEVAVDVVMVVLNFGLFLISAFCVVVAIRLWRELRERWPSV
jgi:hypothetical protein